MKKNKLSLQITILIVFIFFLVLFILTDAFRFILGDNNILKLIFEIFFSAVISLIVYKLLNYLIEHVIPTIRIKRRLKRESPEDALDALIEEFNISRKKKQMGRTVRLSLQINHLYEYLDEKDKKRLKNKMKPIFEYSGGNN